jgi:hypothetical protein
MKALSGYAEWFWLLAKNIKPVENRIWPLDHFYKEKDLPVRVYLHASKTKTTKKGLEFIRERLSPDQLREFEAVNWKQYRGTIIGEITIVGQVYDALCGIIGGSEERQQAVKSGWYTGPYGFVCRDGILYDKPIPYKGRLGFFNVKQEVIDSADIESSEKAM